MHTRIYVFLIPLLILSFFSAEAYAQKNRDAQLKQLHRIAEKGSFDSLREFLRELSTTEKNALIDKTDERSGENALLIAVKKLDSPKVRFLLAEGASVDFVYPKYDNMTPLLYMAYIKCEPQDEWKELDVLTVLLRGGADTEVVSSKSDWTPLMYYVDRRFTDAVDLILKYDADIYYTDSKNRSPVSMVSRETKSPVYKLIKAVADNPDRRKRIEARKASRQEKKMLFVNALEGNDILKIGEALSAMRNIDSPLNEQEQTALMLSVIKENMDAVDLVLSYNPYVLQKDKNGKDAFDYAILTNDPSAVFSRFRGMADIPMDDVEDAVKMDDPELVRQFVKKLKSSEKAKVLNNALGIAVKYDAEDAFSELLTLQANINVAVAPETGRLLLYEIIDDGNISYFKLVMEKSLFNVSSKDAKSGTTLLIYIVRNCPLESLKEFMELYLQKNYVNVNEADKAGMTPLIHAVNFSKTDMDRAESAVDVLMKSGASPHLKDRLGQTALGIAGKDPDRNKTIIQQMKEAPR